MSYYKEREPQSSKKERSEENKRNLQQGTVGRKKVREIKGKKKKKSQDESEDGGSPQNVPDN